MSARIAERLSLCLILITLMSACKEKDLPSTPVVLRGPLLMETSIPECMALPDVGLDVILLSENSVQIKVTGLKANEPVYSIFQSRANGNEKKITCCAHETANRDGSYERVQTLRDGEIDSGFKQWQLLVIHSSGATCTEFFLP